MSSNFDIFPYFFLQPVDAGSFVRHLGASNASERWRLLNVSVLDCLVPRSN